MNIFEQATRNGFRFPSICGELLVETLWQMPLKANSGFDLDTVAKEVNAELKATAEESFVEVKANKGTQELEVKLEIIKYIIADKQAEETKQKQRAEARAKRQKLLEVLARKNDASLEAKSEEELLAELEKIDAAD